MRRNLSFRLLTAAACFVLFAAPSLIAQTVSVSLDNGVHVRAPFTSVDVFPGGSVRVRTPYTAVDIGGRSTHVVQRPVTKADIFSEDELARMSDTELSHAVRESSERFMERMNRFNTGATWQRYLRLPDELQTDDYVGDSAQRAAVGRLLERFDEIAADSRYQKISNLLEFDAMRSVLAELIKRPAATGTTGRTELLPAPLFQADPAEHSLLTPQPNPSKTP
jgi:hypothetical protein